MRLFLLTVILFMLNGCYSSTKNIRPNSRIDLTKGYLVASVSSSGGATDAFYIEGVDFKKKVYLSSGKGVLESYKFNPYKNIKVVEMKPGRYKLTSWQSSVNQGIDTEQYMPKNIKPIYFTIKPGKITYIGSLHLKGIFKKSKIGDYGAGAYATIKNRARRDISLAKRIYPNIKNLPVIYANVPYGKWGEFRDDYAAPSIYVPIMIY